MEWKVYISKVDYWLGLSGLKKKLEIRQLFIENSKNIQIMDDEKGVFAYVIAPDFKGGKSLVELFFFLKKEYRNIDNLNKMLAKVEDIGKLEGCASIKIGANFGYRDEAFMKYLLRKGYNYDTVSKEI